MGQIKVTMKRGLAGKPEPQRLAIKGLGLRRRHQSVLVEDTEAVRGMISKVSHLVQVEEIKE